MDIEALKSVTGFVDLDVDNLDIIYAIADSTQIPLFIKNADKKYVPQEFATTLGIDEFADQINSGKIDIIDGFYKIKTKISQQLNAHFSHQLENDEAYYDIVTSKTIKELQKQNKVKEALMLRRAKIQSAINSPALKSGEHLLSDVFIKYVDLSSRFSLIMDNYENAKSWALIVAQLAERIEDFDKRNNLSDVHKKNFKENLILFLDSATLKDFEGEFAPPLQEEVVLKLVGNKFENVKQFILSCKTF